MPASNVNHHRETARVLIVGDQNSVRAELTTLLEYSGFECLKPESVESDHADLSAAPDLVIMHIAQLGKESPKQVQALRRRYHKPLICLLPYPSETQLPAVAALGANLLLFQPLDLRDAKLRLQLLLWEQKAKQPWPIVDRRHRDRRQTRADPASQRNPESLQILEREKAVICNGKRIRLTPKEYRLLLLLASEPERVFSTQEIIAWLWTDRPRADGANVHQYIYSLRKKIEPNPRHPRYVHTVPAVGYVLTY